MGDFKPDPMDDNDRVQGYHYTGVVVYRCLIILSLYCNEMMMAYYALFS